MCFRKDRGDTTLQVLDPWAWFKYKSNNEKKRWTQYDMIPRLIYIMLGALYLEGIAFTIWGVLGDIPILAFLGGTNVIIATISYLLGVVE